MVVFPAVSAFIGQIIMDQWIRAHVHMWNKSTLWKSSRPIKVAGGWSMDSGFPILPRCKVWSTWTSWVRTKVHTFDWPSPDYFQVLPRTIAVQTWIGAIFGYEFLNLKDRSFWRNVVEVLMWILNMRIFKCDGPFSIPYWTWRAYHTNCKEESEHVCVCVT